MPDYFRRCRNSPICAVERSFAPLRGAHKLLFVVKCWSSVLMAIITMSKQGKTLRSEEKRMKRRRQKGTICRDLLINRTSLNACQEEKGEQG